MKKFNISILFFMLILSANSFSQNTNNSPNITKLEQLNEPGKIIGAPIGTFPHAAAESYFTKAKVKTLNPTGSMIGYTELKSGKIDGYAESEIMLNRALASGSLSGMQILDAPVGKKMNVVAGISYKTHIPDLQGKINSFLAQIHKDGSFDEIFNRWVYKSNYTMPEIPAPENPAQKIIVATTGLVEPFSFYSENKLVGFDIELIHRLGQYLNSEIEILIVDVYGVEAALETGKCDCAFSNLTATPERAEAMLFSDPVYTTDIKILIVEQDEEHIKKTFLKKISDSFNKTFIRENRWKLILKGIATTMYISFFSVIAGTLLGFGLCMIHRTKSVFLKNTVKVYVKTLQGTPIVVILMILFYIVFANTKISAVLVAIFAFTMNFSANSCNIFNSGISAVDKGQMEAALALGQTKFQAFFRIVIPQAATQFMSVYQREVISTIKMTSIVGYIAIQDLTRVSDIIRGRTYEAFFPLITTAIIYFLISNLLAELLKAIERKILPNRQNRIIKGVKLS